MRYKRTSSLRGLMPREIRAEDESKEVDLPTVPDNLDNNDPPRPERSPELLELIEKKKRRTLLREGAPLPPIPSPENEQAESTNLGDQDSKNNVANSDHRFSALPPLPTNLSDSSAEKSDKENEEDYASKATAYGKNDMENSFENQKEAMGTKPRTDSTLIDFSSTEHSPLGKNQRSFQPLTTSIYSQKSNNFDGGDGENKETFKDSSSAEYAGVDKDGESSQPLRTPIYNQDYINMDGDKAENEMKVSSTLSTHHTETDSQEKDIAEYSVEGVGIVPQLSESTPTDEEIDSGTDLTVSGNKTSVEKGKDGLDKEGNFAESTATASNIVPIPISSDTKGRDHETISSPEHNQWNKDLESGSGVILSKANMEDQKEANQEAITQDGSIQSTGQTREQQEEDVVYTDHQWAEGFESKRNVITSEEDVEDQKNESQEATIHGTSLISASQTAEEHEKDNTNDSDQGIVERITGEPKDQSTAIDEQSANTEQKESWTVSSGTLANVDNGSIIETQEQKRDNELPPATKVVSPIVTPNAATNPEGQHLESINVNSPIPTQEQDNFATKEGESNRKSVSWSREGPAYASPVRSFESSASPAPITLPPLNPIQISSNEVPMDKGMVDIESQETVEERKKKAEKTSHMFKMVMGLVLVGGLSFLLILLFFVYSPSRSN